MLNGKNILLGISGGIAAYKAAFLVRLLVKEGANVKVVMTSSATNFVTPLTLSTLSKNEVLIDFVNSKTGIWHNHVDLGLWADVMLIAPATAKTISKMTFGHAEDLLTATYLSAKCGVVVCPAMDLDMYQHPSTKNNLKALESYGNHIIYAKHGELASGLVGEGRMAEPEEIVSYLHGYFNLKALLKGKKVLVTAGPTYEKIDPVRYIGNHSSGKMGYALAKLAAQNGAEVILISGPSQEDIDAYAINKIEVTSAQDMCEAVMENAASANIIIMAAAVADYTPESYSTQKVKKQEGDMFIKLKRTKDILSELGKRKQPHQFLLGFAMETENEITNAKEKLRRKDLDAIVLNKLNDEGAGFKHDTNQITIIGKDNKVHEFELKPKSEVAKDIITYLAEHINA